MNLKHLRSPLRVKATDIGEDGVFSGYGSVFNTVDSGGDYIINGAFAETLAQHANDNTRAKLLWQHRHEEPIGSWIEMREDDHGLYCKGRLLLDVAKAREAYALLKAGELDGLSIGYECQQWEFAQPDELQSKYGYVGMHMQAGSVRVLKQIDLWEVSLVTFPMNAAARVDAVKAVPRVLDLTPISEALARRGRVLAA